MKPTPLSYCAVGLLALSSVLAAQNTRLSADDALHVVRAANTAELDVKLKTQQFVGLQTLLEHKIIKHTGASFNSQGGSSAMVANYQLSIVVSEGRDHYRLSMVPVEQCATAYFSDDSGVIYLGKALGCAGGEDSAKTLK